MYAKELEKLHTESVRENENIKHLEQEKNRFIEDQINQQNQEKVIRQQECIPVGCVPPAC